MSAYDDSISTKKIEDHHSFAAELTCYLHNEIDITRARYLLAEMCRRHSTPTVEMTRLITATSELCSNAVKYASSGVMYAYVSQRDLQGKAIEITIKVADEGPGINDIEWALREKTSSGGTLGLGLSGTKRLVDTLYIESPITGRSYGSIITLSVRWRRMN